MLIISIMIPDWQMSMNVYLEQVAVHSYAITPWEATYVVAALAIHLAQTTKHAMARQGHLCSKI